MEYKIKTPVTKEDIAMLRAGDRVLLSGVVYTARDQAHKRLTEAMNGKDGLPFELEGSAVYYVGPTPEREDGSIGSAGPTTSGRMDTYSPVLIKAGCCIMIGKGRRSETVKQAIREEGAIYLAAIGGAGALMAECITSAEIIAWEDLGCEAVRRLTVKDMPLIVEIDSQGNDFYDIGPETYLKSSWVLPGQL